MNNKDSVNVTDEMLKIGAGLIIDHEYSNGHKSARDTAKEIFLEMLSISGLCQSIPEEFAVTRRKSIAKTS